MDACSRISGTPSRLPRSSDAQASNSAQPTLIAETSGPRCTRGLGCFVAATSPLLSDEEVLTLARKKVLDKGIINCPAHGKKYTVTVLLGEHPDRNNGAVILVSEAVFSQLEIDEPIPSEFKTDRPKERVEY